MNPKKILSSSGVNQSQSGKRFYYVATCILLLLMFDKPYKTSAKGITGDAAVKHYNEWMDKAGMSHLKTK